MLVPGDALVPLLHRVRLNGSEWRMDVVAVLISSRPVSARQIALPPGFDYGFVKRIVRGLVAWRILTATPKGLSFQPDATRWTAAPAGGRGGYGRRCFVKPLVTFLARRARNRDPSCSSRTTVDDDVLPVTGAASIRRRIVLSHNGVLTGGPTTRARSVRRSDAQERDAHPGVDHDALVEDMIKDLDNTTVRAGPLDGHSLHLRVAPGRGTNADAPMMHSRCLDLRTISVRTCGRNGELPCPR